MSQLTEQHGGELRPAGEPFGVALALMGVHQSGELVARYFVKQLTEQTGALYHAIVLRLAWSEPRLFQPNSPTRTEGFINLTFWKAIYDNSDQRRCFHFVWSGCKYPPAKPGALVCEPLKAA